MNKHPQPSNRKSTAQRSAEKNLFAGEKVSFLNDTAPPKATDEELNSRYAKGEIRIVTEQARYPLAGILQMLRETVEGEGGQREPRYKLDPEYQRRHRWDEQRKSRLIESFLLNVPVPPVFLYEQDLARFEVMDGRQRLTALSDFYSNKFALTGLEYWSGLEGRKYDELPSKVRDGIDRRYISSIILLKETAASEEQAAMLKKIVFERLNSGGVKLEGHETRNAVYNGPLNQLCIQLSENVNFRRMWGIPLNPTVQTEAEDEMDESGDEGTQAGTKMFQRMEDVELVLRFFAYRQIGDYKAGLNKITEFLDKFIVEGNRFPQSILDQYRSMFESTITFLWAALEADAFVMTAPSKRRAAAKIVYDPIMYVANSPEVIPNHAKLLEHKDVLRTELEKMYGEHHELFAGRRTNFVDTQKRNECVAAAFANAIAQVENY